MSENSMEDFLIWVSKRKLVTRNNASLRMNSDRSQFVDYRVNDLWCAWQASRQAVVVELPCRIETLEPEFSCPNAYAEARARNDALRECRSAIESAGLRCEEKS